MWCRRWPSLRLSAVKSSKGRRRPRVRPASFGGSLGAGLPSYVSSVVWGFINIVPGYGRFRKGKVAGGEKFGRLCFFAGIVAIGLFLSFVFSRPVH